MTYEKVTAYIPALEAGLDMEWIEDRRELAPGEPRHFPYVRYGPEVYEFLDSFYGIPAVTDYEDTLDELGLWHRKEGIYSLRVEETPGEIICGLFFRVRRAERFSEGSIWSFIDSGFALRCLRRLKALDGETADQQA
ncbi:DUF6508 domain-containing protein [Actinobaculum sp. 352]|uniref:DUF6508 domain-containing protein n=1 Tax=Actinobaculum sp. 352 TaxID=2490946 RepID=UPI000F7DF65C|nr:DUF6508 domain-containing protein [Actinobaculum sp. 352]RTE49753.1 hypothetical protein EKN07_04275 [Actinobaculum sp. 352]